MTTGADLAQLDIDGDPIEPAGDGGALIGCSRVSTRDQKLHRQVDALTVAGCQRILEEKLSGKNTDCPELASCLDYLRPGNTIVVLKLWRLGRSLLELAKEPTFSLEAEPQPDAAARRGTAAGSAGESARTGRADRHVRPAATGRPSIASSSCTLTVAPRAG